MLLEDLPEEIIHKIFTHLNEESLVNLNLAYNYQSDSIHRVITCLYNRFLRDISLRDYNLGRKFKNEGWSYETASMELIHKLFYKTQHLLHSDSLQANVVRSDLIGVVSNIDFPQRRVTSFVIYKEKAFLSLNDSSVESRNLNDLSKCMTVLLQPFDGVFPDYVLTKGCQIHLKDKLLGAADVRRQKLYLWNVETEFILSEININETGFPYDLKINSKNIFILSGFSLIIWKLDAQNGIKNNRPTIIPEFDQQDNWLERHSLQVSDDFVVTKSTCFEGPADVNYIHIRRCGPDGFIGPIIRNIVSSIGVSISEFCLSPDNILVICYRDRKMSFFPRQTIDVLNVSTGEIIHQIPTRRNFAILPVTWIGDNLYVKVVPKNQVGINVSIEKWNIKSNKFGTLEGVTLENIADLIDIGLSHIVKVFNVFPITPYLENTELEFHDYDEFSTFKIYGVIYNLWESIQIL